MSEIRVSVPQEILQRMLSIAEEIALIEKGLTQALTILERTRFQASTDLMNHLSRKLDKHFYISLSQRMTFQQSTLISTSEAIQKLAMSHVTDWNAVIEKFREQLVRLPEIQAEMKRFTEVNVNNLFAELKHIKFTNQSLIQREKDSIAFISSRTYALQENILQLVSPLGNLGSTISATKDELEHLRYQQTIRSQVVEEKIAGIRKFMSTSGFQLLEAEQLYNSAEAAVLEKANEIFTNYMMKGDNKSSDDLQQFHAILASHLSRLRDWENKINVMQSTLENDFHMSVRKPMERELKAMKATIIDEQNKLVENLRQIREDLSDAYREHRRGVDLIRAAKTELDTLKARWNEDINILKKKYLFNEVEELRRIYEKAVPEQSRIKSFELCAEAESLFTSTEQNVHLWQSLMAQRIKVEDAKMQEMEQVLNRLLNELVQTTHARSLGIDELNRRLSHKTFELMQFNDTRMDEALFKQKLAGKVNKADTDIAFGIRCPAEHDEVVVPKPIRDQTNREPSGSKRSNKLNSVEEDARLLQEYREQCALNKDVFSFIKFFTGAILREKHLSNVEENMVSTAVSSADLGVNLGALMNDSIDTHLLQVAPSVVQQQVLSNLALRDASQKSLESPRPRSVPSALSSKAKEQIRLRPGTEKYTQDSTPLLSLSNIYASGSNESSPNIPGAPMKRPRYASGKSFHGRKSYNARIARTVQKANEDINRITNSLIGVERNLEEAESRRAINADLTGIRSRSRPRFQAESESVPLRNSHALSTSHTINFRSSSEKTAINDKDASTLEKDGKVSGSTSANNVINTGLMDDVSPPRYRQPRVQCSSSSKSAVSMQELPESFALIGYTFGKDYNKQRQQLSARRATHSATTRGEQFLLQNMRGKAVVTPLGELNNQNKTPCSKANTPTRPSSAGTILKRRSSAFTNPLLVGEPDRIANFLVMGNPGKEDLPKVLSNIKSAPLLPPVQPNKKPFRHALEDKMLLDIQRAKSNDVIRRPTTDETKRVLREVSKIIQ